MKEEFTGTNDNRPFSIRSVVGQQIGSRNLQTQKPCGDVIFIRKTPQLYFYGLADGQSGKSRGVEGGTACLKSVADCIQDYGISNIICTPFPDEIPFILIRAIRGAILSLAKEQECAFSEYASTLLATAIDPVTGRYIIIHLGDGCAIGIRNDSSIMILDSPEKGFSNQHTWLTTSDHVASHLHVSMGNLCNLKRVILLTDGAISLCYGKNISSKAQCVMNQENANFIAEYLDHSKPSDDASCIVLDVETNREYNGTEQLV